MKPETRTLYAQRLDPVLRWLAAHPDADPDLHRLADLACLSPYHFHRVYRAMMGKPSTPPSSASACIAPRPRWQGHRHR